KTEGAGAGVCRRRHGGADRRPLRRCGPARPHRRSGLHVSGGPRCRGREGVPRACAAVARRLLPVRFERGPRACRASSCGRGLCGRRREGAYRAEGAQLWRRKASAADALTMPSLVLGILVLILGLWVVNAYSKADPKVLAKLAHTLRPYGGFALV